MSSRKPPKGFIVQDRDVNLLRTLGELGVVDREQAKLIAGFGSTTRANTRLLQLVRAGLLRRFFLGSGGGRKALYALSPKGAQLAAVALRGPRRRKDEMLVADFYIQHQLTVNDIYCALNYKLITVPGVSAKKWIAFHEQIAPSLRLIPDGYVELASPAGRVNAFLEVDLGHEGLAVWREKTRQYLQLAISGEFQQRFHEERFRVLVLANSVRRMHSIRKAVSTVTKKIFWFATFESAASNFFAPVWYRPSGDQSQPLLEQTL